MSDKKLSPMEDILHEKRERAKEIRANLSCVPIRRDDQIAEAEELESDARRIESAWKHDMQVAASTAATTAVNLTNEKWRRDSGNVAAIRDALVQSRVCIASMLRTLRDHERAKPVLAKIDAALAMPARNCDKYPDPVVLRKMFGRYCATRPCQSCPFYKGPRCEFQFALEEAEEKMEGGDE